MSDVIFLQRLIFAIQKVRSISNDFSYGDVYLRTAISASAKLKSTGIVSPVMVMNLKFWAEARPEVMFYLEA